MRCLPHYGRFDVAIIYSDVRNMIERFRPESEGKRVITLGRLSVYLHRQEISHMKGLFADDKDASNYLKNYQWGEYSERFFRDILKCSVVDSMDFSDYQGATIIHDLQEPILENLCGKYDLVFDGGTMEHVFDIRAALANAIQLTRTGGLVYINTPCNNLCGHGFYQFSPELMYRVMSSDNGMAVILNRLGVARFPSIEATAFHRVYDVVDPASVQCRVGLMSSRPVYMMVMARKTRASEPLSMQVLQSDYCRRWSGSGTSLAGWRRIAKRILERLPSSLRRRIMAYQYSYLYSLTNTRFYRRLW